jgi:hypothetical protein
MPLVFTRFCRKPQTFFARVKMGFKSNGNNNAIRRSDAILAAIAERKLER